MITISLNDFDKFSIIGILSLILAPPRIATELLDEYLKHSVISFISFSNKIPP